ncbi:MAG: O-antigen ligase family protein [Patescibacteria group bacterium]|nr:O-antigen ligase family protein [Patescibacteria group bacterium]MBU2509156.1 O-antigen ligase family protein [Patescibacteria group bacterium]
MKLFSWGLFVALAACAIFIAIGAPLGPVLFLAVFITLVFAYRFPYATLYAVIFLMPFLGLTISLPTGELAIGKRAFGGAIDISVAEALILALLLAWALKILVLWVRRRDINWRPNLPLAKTYALLFFAHITSALSPLKPDPILVIKFSLRPILFAYLAFVALPVNLLRSKRRIITALSVVAATGTIGALNGAVSLFFVGASSQFIRRAHPLPMFGIHALGDNHNLLAELLAVTLMSTLALTFLVKQNRTRQMLYATALLQFMVGLLTFSRTLWVVFILQAVFLGFVEYRQQIKRYGTVIIAAVLLSLPIAWIMLNVGLSNVAQSSNSTRVALTEIAAGVFLTSPIFGSGAGTFVDRVGSAYIFKLEYGSPLDSHGVLQKLAAETGIIGLLAFGLVMYEFLWIMRRGLKDMKPGATRTSLMFLTTGAMGAVVYQIFNTNYWTGKMWLPIGIALAALYAFQRHHKEKELSL